METSEELEIYRNTCDVTGCHNFGHFPKCTKCTLGGGVRDQCILLYTSKNVNKFSFLQFSLACKQRQTNLIA